MPISGIWRKNGPLLTEASDRPEEHDYIDGRLFSYGEMLAICPRYRYRSQSDWLVSDK